MESIIRFWSRLPIFYRPGTAFDKSPHPEFLLNAYAANPSLEVGAEP